jgi:protein-disulfide isomerase
MSSLKIPVNQNDHISGNNDAPIELVEYADFQCSYCGEAYLELKELKKHLGDNLKFVFRNFPLSQTHKEAKNAALAAEAAGAQGKFWEMHDKLFENQNNLKLEDLIRYAEEIGLDLEKFKNELENKTYLEKVEEDFDGGIRSGVNTTPSFYVNGQKQKELNEEELMEITKTEHH